MSFRYMMELKEESCKWFGSPNLAEAQAMPLKERCEIVQKHIYHLQRELAELGTASGADYWKKDKVLDEQAILEEYADCLHVLLSVGQILGFSADQIEAKYCEKHAKNKTRQDWKRDKKAEGESP